MLLRVVDKPVTDAGGGRTATRPSATESRRTTTASGRLLSQPGFCLVYVPEVFVMYTGGVSNGSVRTKEGCGPARRENH